MAGLGLTKGMAFANDFDKDIDRLYQREQYAAQVKSEKERKTLFYAQQMKKGHTDNARTQQELDEYYKGLTGEVADLYMSNPNFDTDLGPNGMPKFLEITDKFINNPILQRDMQVKQEFDKLRDAYSNQKITQSQFNSEMERYNAYIDPNIKGDPYVFSNPKMFQTSELLQEANSQLQPLTENYLDPANHMWKEKKETPFAAVYKTAQAQYANEDYRIVIDKEYQTMVKNNPDTKTMFPTAVEYWAERIKVGEPVEDAFRTWDYKWQKSLESGNNGSGPAYAYALTNEISKLRALQTAKDENGNDINVGKAPASNLSFTLTGFGDENKEMNIGPASGIMVYSKAAGGYVKSDLNVNAKSINATNFLNIGGLLYLEADVAFENGFGLELGKDPVPTIAAEKLEDYGFSSQSTVSEPLVEKGGSSLSIRKGQRNTGKVLIPLQINETTMTAWDDKFLGKEHAKDIASYYTSNIDNIINSDPALLRHKLKQDKGIDIGSGVTNLQYSKELSADYGEEYSTAMYNGEKIAINMATGQKKRLIPKE